MSTIYDPENNCYLQGKAIFKFPIAWDILKDYPALYKACRDDTLELFQHLTISQCLTILRVLHGGSYANMEPDDSGFQEATDCDRFIYHLKIYEFAAKYGLTQLADASLHHVRAAGDNLSFYVLAGTLANNNYLFGANEQAFTAYIKERSEMNNETLFQGDAERIGDEFANSMTLENMLLIQIVEMKLELQYYEALTEESQ
ncbi:hypothetical protein FLONG3_3217 [Fusarium longipes]|uniref:Uncharacterized protein n=1 Tax=Fusarium longipes TaxID=694270 RepID=A0A395T1Y1_9HYPO|nr:hypothetical protein FLONG3_3217 [Fusarium longipes]